MRDPDRRKRESRQVGRSGAPNRLREAGETRIDGRELALERPAGRVDSEGRVAGDGVSARLLNQPAEQALVVPDHGIPRERLRELGRMRAAPENCQEFDTRRHTWVGE